TSKVAYQNTKRGGHATYLAHRPIAQDTCEFSISEPSTVNARLHELRAKIRFGSTHTAPLLKEARDECFKLAGNRRELLPIGRQHRLAISTRPCPHRRGQLIRPAKVSTLAQ